MGQVIQLRSEEMLTIRSVGEALRYGDRWQAHAMRLEALLALATAQRDASDLLLSIAEEEILRLRGLLPANGG